MQSLKKIILGLCAINLLSGCGDFSYQGPTAYSPVPTKPLEPAVIKHLDDLFGSGLTRGQREE